MLKKYNRLTKNNDFDNVFKNGKGTFFGILGIKFIKNNLTLNRVGILVGIKVSKKAVVRNKIRRRIREAIKEFLTDIGPGNDIVITTSPKIKEADFKSIENDLRTGLKRLRLL